MSEIVQHQMSLDELAIEIRAEVAAADQAWSDALAHAIRAGDLLIEAKSRKAHGKWLPWLKANFDFTQQTASVYMRLAANYGGSRDLPPSIQKALALLAGPDDDEDDDDDGNDDTEPAVWSDEELRLRDVLEEGVAVVVNLRDHEALIEWAKERDLFVRIDRQTLWGNPFIVDDDGDREAVIAAYRDHYLPHKPSLLARLGELEGKALGCWCAPDLCHGDVLADKSEGC